MEDVVDVVGSDDLPLHISNGILLQNKNLRVIKKKHQEISCVS